MKAQGAGHRAAGNTNNLKARVSRACPWVNENLYVTSKKEV
jgi:hypothetical protein